jgi:hypothetical protein
MLTRVRKCWKIGNFGGHNVKKGHFIILVCLVTGMGFLMADDGHVGLQKLVMVSLGLIMLFLLIMADGITIAICEAIRESKKP